MPFLKLFLFSNYFSLGERCGSIVFFHSVGTLPFEFDVCEARSHVAESPSISQNLLLLLFYRNLAQAWFSPPHFSSLHPVKQPSSSTIYSWGRCSVEDVVVVGGAVKPCQIVRICSTCFLNAPSLFLFGKNFSSS